MLRKILPRIFTELRIPKFAWSLFLKILNTCFLKLFPHAAPLPHHCHAAPPPHHPIYHNGVCKWRTGWIEDKVGSFKIQPTTNDVTGLTHYSSNIAIYANVHVRVISYINFSTFKFFQMDKISPTSNFLRYFFDMQFFLHFRRSTHNILSKYLKFYPKCLKNSATIFPKFLKYFHEVFVPNFSKFLTTFPKVVLIFL